MPMAGSGRDENPSTSRQAYTVAPGAWDEDPSDAPAGTLYLRARC